MIRPWAVAPLALLVGCGSAPVRDGGVTPPRPRTPDVAPGTADAAKAAKAADAADAADAAKGRPIAGPASGGLVAIVAGSEISAADLLGAWLHRESPNVRAYLDELVLSRLVVAESARLGVELPPGLLEATLAETRADMEKDVLQNGGTTIESFIETRLGLDPEHYFDRLREETAIDLLAERCVRAWLLATERCEVRVIVVEDRADVDLVEAKLELGADFSQLARDYSVEDSKAGGGRIPPVVRANVALARLAFSTPVGQVGGPVFERDRYLFLRVDARPAPLEGDWKAVGGPVEASLSAGGIEDPEYWQWKTAMLSRYEVDMTPFLELVGPVTK